MKTVFAYLKSRVFFFGVFLLCTAVFAGVCVLENLPLHRFFYAATIMLVLLFLLCLIDFYFFQKRYNALKRFTGHAPLPPSFEPLGQQYEKIISRQQQEMMAIETRLTQKGRDQMDYYTLWMHQIKTPIAAMTLMLTDGQKPLQNELFKIEQYVEMALNYLRLNAEETDYLFADTAVDDIVKSALRKYAGLFIMKKLSLQYEPTADIALTDKKWLQFILEQLLSNAIKYTPEGGSIRIACAELMLSVTDTGIGIAKEDLPRVFDKGYTGFNGRTHEKSTGIGLYLAKKAADDLGYPLHITSEIGKGTAAVLDLNRPKLTKM